ncbi:MAG: thioredoxin family protein [Candidatus Cloacimonetes bacterium]|nr:thioredoxin family protein [Candidatus Cloacimonadota bacterium]MCF7813012.1 thioredoxin family protein [Candidatus Cloacimonadota bacterium]MCF7867256.1 thioredoxin family protein [Candidatus Cloacimonadota bacterium]MCF7882700.1 thioredoxin family protein [Candidatus Cloacimonadota bacterium]
MDFAEIKHKQFSFVYITTKDCNVCKVLQPQLREMAQKYSKADFELIELDDHPAAAGEFMAFAVPTFIVYSDGKELLRASRNLDLYDIETKLYKYYKMIFD